MSRDVSQMNPEITELREELKSLLDAGQVERAVGLVAQVHASDLADLVEDLPDEQQVALLTALRPELASDTLAEMEEGEERAELVAALSPAKSAELLQEMPDDDAADIIGELEPEERQRVLESLPAEDAGDLRDLLGYGEETAGGLMTTELVAVEATLTAREALEEVRHQGREVEDFYTVFVVDPQRRLLGTVGLDDLVTADPDEPVENLVEPAPATVLPDVDQEEVGHLIARYNLAAIPVVDEDGVLLGRITFDDVIDVIEAEQTEDILRLAGVSDDEELRASWTESVRQRLPWLFLNLVTAFLAGLVPYLFGATIQNAVILASFMPVIAGMGGNTATQALAVTVRRLAVNHMDPEHWSMVRKEVMVGLVNGLVVGGVTALVAAMVPGGNPVLGGVVMFSMWGNMLVAGFAGSVIPALLDRVGVDPAVASSVFVTTLTDLCGFLLLLGMASKFLA
ncbi:MAG: magnesium transporter [Gemmatimonadota bacterium]